MLSDGSQLSPFSSNSLWLLLIRTSSNLIWLPRSPCIAFSPSRLNGASLVSHCKKQIHHFALDSFRLKTRFALKSNFPSLSADVQPLPTLFISTPSLLLFRLRRIASLVGGNKDRQPSREKVFAFARSFFLALKTILRYGWESGTEGGEEQEKSERELFIIKGSEMERKWCCGRDKRAPEFKSSSTQPFPTFLSDKLAWFSYHPRLGVKWHKQAGEEAGS